MVGVKLKHLINHQKKLLFTFCHRAASGGVFSLHLKLIYTHTLIYPWKSYWPGCWWVRPCRWVVSGGVRVAYGAPPPPLWAESAPLSAARSPGSRLPGCSTDSGSPYLKIQQHTPTHIYNQNVNIQKIRVRWMLMLCLNKVGLHVHSVWIRLLSAGLDKITNRMNEI